MQVTAKGISGGVTSDGEGRFFFPITESRDYIITIEKAGYTYAQRRARGVVGRDVAVDPVYLTPLDSKLTRIGPGTTVLTIQKGLVSAEKVARALGEGSCAIPR